MVFEYHNPNKTVISVRTTGLPVRIAVAPIEGVGESGRPRMKTARHQPAHRRMRFRATRHDAADRTQTVHPGAAIQSRPPLESPFNPRFPRHGRNASGILLGGGPGTVL